MRRIVTYGSLRPGLYNFTRFQESFGKEEIKFVEMKVIEGYDLYSLGAYPGIKEGKGKLVVDVLEVSDRCFNMIDQMERHAGYKSKYTEDGTIYLYERKVREADLVPSGDWLVHSNLKSLQPETINESK